MSTDSRIFAGVDVGTGSARVGLFDATGKLLAHAKRDITMWKPQPDFVQQSSGNIWDAICACMAEALAAGKIEPSQVAGLGFDATCSLVALDADFNPVSVSPDNAPEQDTIVWMDHRAIPEANEINAKGHRVLKYVGDTISPEMETPKLLWLKRHHREAWAKAKHFFDLPDFLTWRATGAGSRSVCSTACKWTYMGHEEEGWDKSYFETIGLEDLAAEGFERIGTEVKPLGEAVGSGLSEEAAKELGLQPGTAVGVSIIDAHAGGVGMIGAALSEGEAVDFNARLALIGGTSSCHMAVAPNERFIPGVWGPYYSAMVPDMWLAEGGQSATGALVDHIIFNHHQSAALEIESKAADQSPYEWLNNRLEELAKEKDVPMAELTAQLHVYDAFHGNRSPRADASLKGMISGLSLSSSLDDLALLYLATVQAVAYGTRHIIEEMNKAGYAIDTVLACGGGTKNPVFLQQHADIIGAKLVLPEEPEAVLLGSAILGAVAAGTYATIPEAMAAMSRAGSTIEPDVSIKPYHDKKYTAFQQLYDAQMAIRATMGA